MFVFFFFQAEDGIRDGHVTGVQTCALPISLRRKDCDRTIRSASIKAVPVSFDIDVRVAAGSIGIGEFHVGIDEHSKPGANNEGVQWAVAVVLHPMYQIDHLLDFGDIRAAHPEITHLCAAESSLYHLLLESDPGI